MKVSELLKSSLALLGPNGEHWTQGTLARDAEGVCSRDSARPPVCFCSDGALRMSLLGEIPAGTLNSGNMRDLLIGMAGEVTYSDACNFLSMACQGGNTCSGMNYRFVYWQDTSGRTFAEVKTMFEKAIAMAEMRELQGT